MDVSRFNRLLQQIKYDKRAITEIYEEYYPRMILHLRRKFGKLISAEDVAHEVFLLLMSLERISEVEFPASWLYKLADNKAVDRIRLEHNELQLSENYADPFDPDELIIREDAKKALKRLDKESQMILYLHVWEGYNYKEISDLLQIGYANVRTKASRAFKSLKKFL